MQLTRMQINKLLERPKGLRSSELHWTDGLILAVAFSLILAPFILCFLVFR